MLLEIWAVRLEMDAHASKSEEGHEREYDRQTRGTFVFKSTEFVFISNPLLRMAMDNYAEALPKRLY